jgi:hypothetical protein
MRQTASNLIAREANLRMIHSTFIGVHGRFNDLSFARNAANPLNVQ